MITTHQKATRYDPSHTTTLRRAFERQMTRRFIALRGLIRKAIVEDDVFGMIDTYSPGKKAFAFARSGDKVGGFMDWLRSEADKGILEIGRFDRIGSAADKAWTNMYITDSYKRGVMRARYEMGKAGYRGDFPAGELMNNPFHVDRLGVLYTRVFSDLKGITDAMDMQISRVLAQGIADGDNPRLLARKLTRTITGPAGDLGITDTLGRFIPAQRRAQMLARTEIIRAHHIANVTEMRNWGIEGVHVQAEWQTAGDDGRTCDDCFKMESAGVYTLDEIEKLIPLHPSCRCVALPMRKDKRAEKTQDIKGPVDDFVPAKNIQEVDSRLSKFGDVNLGDISLDKKNEILRAGEDVFTRFSLKKLTNGYQIQKKGKSSYARARFRTVGDVVNPQSIEYQKTFLTNPVKISAKKHNIFLNSQQHRIQKMEQSIKIPGLPQRVIDKRLTQINELKAATRWSINEHAKNPLYTASVHENAHVVYRVHNLEGRFLQNLQKHKVSSLDRLAVSEYGASVTEELFCEIMAAYYSGIKIPQNALNAFLETIKGI